MIFTATSSFGAATQNVMELFTEDARRNPFPSYERIRNACPVTYDERTDFWMIFHYDGVKRALTDAFSSDLRATANQPTPPWVIFMDPPRHTPLRALIMRAFSPRMVAGLERRIRDLARELLSAVLNSNGIDFAADFAIPLPLRVIAEMIGIPTEDWPRFRQWSDAILLLSQAIVGRGLSVEAAQLYQRASTEMAEYISKLIERRKQARCDDLLSALVEAEVDGCHLSAEQIISFTQLLLVAGNETTTNLLNNALLCFIEHPGELAKLRANPELLPSAIEEVLRYRSPVQFVFRGTRHDVEMEGTVIPGAKRVLTMIGSANRDPRQFRDPDRFEITRDPNPHLAFGHGIHFCVGASLARLEARVAFTEFLNRVENFSYAGAEAWRPRAALNVLGPERLPISVELR